MAPSLPAGQITPDRPATRAEPATADGPADPDLDPGGEVGDAASRSVPEGRVEARQAV